MDWCFQIVWSAAAETPETEKVLAKTLGKIKFRILSALVSSVWTGMQLWYVCNQAG